MEKNLSIIPQMPSAIIDTTPDGPAWAVMAVTSPINSSIDNDGDIIYNGSDEGFDVPVLCKTRSIFNETYENNKDITTYPMATRMVCIDIDRLSVYEREETLRKYLNKKTVDMWRGCLTTTVSINPKFSINSSAIHIDSVNDAGEPIWFEMIVNAVY